MGGRVGRIDAVVAVLGDTVLADEGPGQTVRVVDVVEAEAALDTQPALVCRAVAALHVEQLPVADMKRDLAADPAVGTQRIHGAIGGRPPHPVRIQKVSRHQRARRARLDALAAGDAGAEPHGVGAVEDDLRGRAAPGHADNVVDLDLAAGAHAEAAVDARIEVDGHRRMAAIGVRGGPGGEAAGLEAGLVDPVPEHGIGVVGAAALRLVGEQQLEHHDPGLDGSLRVGGHLHARGRRAQARRHQGALALDLDHAGAAVAVGPVAGRVAVAEVRDGRAEALRHLPDGLAGRRGDLLAVELEDDGLAHVTSSAK